jgi:acetyl-CoA carboxylase carboxyltransferase component
VVSSAIGLGAARVVSARFSIMPADVGSLFNASPKAVEGATFEEGVSFSGLDGPGLHCTNGTIDNMAQGETGRFLLTCGSSLVVECTDPVGREDIALRSVVPRETNKTYNMRGNSGGCGGQRFLV